MVQLDKEVHKQKHGGVPRCVCECVYGMYSWPIKDSPDLLHISRMNLGLSLSMFTASSVCLRKVAWPFTCLMMDPKQAFDEEVVVVYALFDSLELCWLMWQHSSAEHNVLSMKSGFQSLDAAKSVTIHSTSKLDSNHILKS